MLNTLPTDHDEMLDQVYKSKNAGLFRVIDVYRTDGKKKMVMFTIEFLNTGTKKGVQKSSISRGSVGDEAAKVEGKAKYVYEPGDEVKGVKIISKLFTSGVITYYEVEHLTSKRRYKISQREIQRGFSDTEDRIQNEYPHLKSLWD
ncbi:MAG: hypothetical protein ACRDCE_22805 [Cetobacterium sp.]|uniref:hypothetical protein n=1 Tax=Cetobacterium sp. TaxID=2071632 RepID=UPI003EE44C6B